MRDVAIRVDSLGKRYHLGGQQERYHTFADQIKKWMSLRGLFNRVRRAEAKQPFWALKDVSFEVKRGEVVGIIGRNGAGKSTLLKILSRITEPTEGEATIYGRVGSLLEVGTGFHPELTGRENIFLNGAILGMKRAEIVRKLDEIVSFAEVEKFIDTPTKHYSSGMYMRLAFAVAAHLEPEILVVDEVLAVGDAQFQKKCLGKMGEVAKGGRTVLFVSHNMSAVQMLCQSAILLDAGRLEQTGAAEPVISEYLTRGSSRRNQPVSRRLCPELELIDFRFTPEVFPSGGTTKLTIALAASEQTAVDHLSLLVYSRTGMRLALLDLRSLSGPYRIRSGSRFVLEVDLLSVNLIEGEYTAGLFFVGGSFHGDLFNLTSFEVTPASTRASPYEVINRGFVILEATSPQISQAELVDA